jgi:hypothetical protein
MKNGIEEVWKESRSLISSIRRRKKEIVTRYNYTALQKLNILKRTGYFIPGQVEHDQ